MKVFLFLALLTQCLIAAASAKPDLSRFSPEEQRQMKQACWGAESQGPVRYYQCLQSQKEQLLAFEAQQPKPLKAPKQQPKPLKAPKKAASQSVWTPPAGDIPITASEAAAQTDGLTVVKAREPDITPFIAPNDANQTPPRPPPKSDTSDGLIGLVFWGIVIWSWINGALKPKAEPKAEPKAAPASTPDFDDYDTLGVTPKTPREDITLAYRRLARRHHPDMGGNAEKFMRVQAAYDRLCKLYDCHPKV